MQVEASWYSLEFPVELVDKKSCEPGPTDILINSLSLSLFIVDWFSGIYIDILPGDGEGQWDEHNRS